MTAPPGERRWERLTAPELRALAAADALPILPAGSLEQHGPHLPVWTDSLCAHAIALAAAERATMPAVVLPPLWLGLSEHHLPFGGTISLDHATYAAVLGCIARSLRACGFRRLLIVNGHGGNIDPLAVAARELAPAHGLPIVVITWPHAAPDAIAAALTAQRGIQHACEGETSLVLALDPGLVRTDRLPAPDNAAPAADPTGWVRFRSFAERAPGTGTRGDPRAATAEKGARILDAAATAIAAAMAEPALWTPPDAVWAPDRARQ